MNDEQLAPENDEGRERLREEAEAIRTLIRERDMNLGPPRISDWKKACFMALIAGAIFASVYLLVFESQRQALVMLAARGLDLHRTSAEEVFKLGAPPPKAAEPEIRVQGGASVFSDEGLDGVLYADIEVEGGGRRDDGDDDEIEFIKPVRTEGSERAFEFLVLSSEVVQKLVDGKIEGYTFKEWSPVQNDPPRYLLDLLAMSEDGEELHLVWEVNVEKESVRPLSQAARDLAR
jgi:hypothetical protein